MSPKPEDTPMIEEAPSERPSTVSDPHTVQSPPPAFLVRVHPPGPTLGRRYGLGTAPVVIGRVPECAVYDPDPSVSRTHARVEFGPDGRFRVTDLGSTNGTYVNHARVDSAPLAEGDYLRVGTSLYRFLAGGSIEARYLEEIHRLAVTDPLTGLPNRRALGEFLDREADRARRYQRPLTLALFDVDQFKALNDALGHLAGDVTLRAVAELAQLVLRREELLARYGGDEFAVVLPEATAEHGRACGERLRRAVEGHPFEFEGRRYAVTVSVGIGSVGPDERPAVRDLLVRADAKLYEAKQAGRNAVRM